MAQNDGVVEQPRSQDFFAIDPKYLFDDPIEGSPNMELIQAQVQAQLLRDAQDDKKNYIRYSFYMNLKKPYLFALTLKQFEDFIRDFAYGQRHHSKMLCMFQREFDYEQLSGNKGIISPGLVVDIHTDIEVRQVNGGVLIVDKASREAKYRLRGGWIAKAGAMLSHKQIWESYCDGNHRNYFLGPLLPDNVFKHLCDWGQMRNDLIPMQPGPEIELDDHGIPIVRRLELFDEYPEDGEDSCADSALAEILAPYFTLGKMIGEDHPKANRLWRRDGQDFEDNEKLNELADLLKGCELASRNQVFKLADLLSSTHVTNEEANMEFSDEEFEAWCRYCESQWVEPEIQYEDWEVEQQKQLAGEVVESADSKMEKVAEILATCQPQPDVSKVVGLLDGLTLSRSTTEKLIDHMGCLSLS